jgi:hypothetical protein
MTRTFAIGRSSGTSYDVESSLEAVIDLEGDW